MQDSGGRRRLAAFLLAVDHLNNKTDGFWDDVLPTTQVKFVVRDSRRDVGQAVVNSFKLWEFNSIIHIGPASSGPSEQSQSVLKLSDVGIPQISYSATSSSLSDAATSPMFLRTPPSDAFQSQIMVRVVAEQRWHRACVLAGTDAYSNAGGEEVARFITTQGGGELMLIDHVSFVTGSGDV